MKEIKTKRFEFPDSYCRDPVLIPSLAAPFSRQKITHQNIDTALSWFDELCSTTDLEMCDQLFSAQVVAQVLTNGETRQDRALMTARKRVRLQAKLTRVLDALTSTTS